VVRRDIRDVVRIGAAWGIAVHRRRLLPWHLRRGGQLTIREIIATQPGAGVRMLNYLRETPGARCIFAKCPVDLAANTWYARRGFVLVRVETTKTGRALNCWELTL
jgi:hypothetical protein